MFPKEYNGKKVDAMICSYTYSFQPYTKWLYLNGIDYELVETDLYEDGLEILIFEQEEKSKRRLVGFFMVKVFPAIREMQYQQQYGHKSGDYPYNCSLILK